MNCPKCGRLTVKLSVVQCTTGDAEKRGCPRCRGIWFQQLAGQSCLGHEAPLKEEFWPHRAAGGITKNKMSTFKPTTEKQFAYLAEELRRVIDTAIDPGYFPPGMHTPEEEQFIRQEVDRLLADKH